MATSNPQAFLAAATFAVAGASRDRTKYGNQVFRALVDSNRSVVPLNKSATEIEGYPSYASLQDLPAPPEALSIVTPPPVTREVVAQAIAAGVRHLWMQPGAEDADASAQARAAGLNVIDDGACLLVYLALERARR